MASSTIQARFATLNGTFLSRADFSATIPYPEGFTFYNCQVISLMVQDGDQWKNGFNVNTVGARVFASQVSAGVRVFNNDSALYGHSFRVCLGKV